MNTEKRQEILEEVLNEVNDFFTIIVEKMGTIHFKHEFAICKQWQVVQMTQWLTTVLM